jgi:hypothetical protein
MSEQPHVVSFDTMEDAFEFMRKGEDYGNRNLHPKQQGITWGDHWVRFYNVADRIIIFGYVYTDAEQEASERKVIEKIADPEERRMALEEELPYSMETVRESHTRGLMWGRAYSTMGDDLGSTHRFYMWPISAELFRAAERVNWDVDGITDPELRAELEAAWQEYRAHALSVAASGDQP